MYMTRKEAIDVLVKVNAGNLAQDLEDGLDELISILEKEDEYRLSLWGAEDEAIDLFTARREDLITPEWEQHCHDLWLKYKMPDAEKD